jgi:hypothetical protein
VPDRSYVSDLEPSLHGPDTVFAAFDNHKHGDFKPYLYRSDDRGRTWTSIAGDLPERGTVYTVVQDHERAELLFAGTEFGVFFTLDAGRRWTRLKGGLPTIAVRDLEIQRRENDLIAATFGRGIMILDDYSPLRLVDLPLLEREAALFPVKRTRMFVPSTPLGLRDKAFQGDAFFAAPNPPFGAVLTYYLKDELKPKKAARRTRELEQEERGETPAYPDWDTLRREEREEKPAIVLTIRDDEGNVVRRIEGPVEAGFHRVAWDLRYPPATPVSLEPPATDNPFDDPPIGPFVVPGTYSVSLERRVDGETTALGEPRRFETVALGNATLGARDREAVLAFQRKTARLQRAVLGASRVAAEARQRVDHLQLALRDTPDAEAGLQARALALQERLADLQVLIDGDPVLAARNEPAAPSILDRVQRVVYGQWTSTSAPTGTQLAAYRVSADAFSDVLADLRRAIETDLEQLEDEMEAAHAPWTPGRVPRWVPE